MEVSKNKSESLYQLMPKGSVQGIKGNVFSKGRVLIGRVDSCDLVVPNGIVSAVHAVLELTPKGAKVYDMNSKNGTFINGEKIVTGHLKIGDEISFGNITFSFKEYVSSTDLPPVLDTLEPQSGAASIHHGPSNIQEKAPELPEGLEEAPLPAQKVKESNISEDEPKDQTQEKSEEEGPYIVYPLASDPKADYSEYIFEDAEEMYPIFKYEVEKRSVEVIILFNDKVFSVDYLPDRKGVYSIVGSSPKGSDIEFPYLGKKDKTPFVEVTKSGCSVNQLPGYEMFHLTDHDMKKRNEGQVHLMEDDILRLTNGHLEIYVRRTDSPPKVKPAPIFGRDNTLKKYFALILLFLVAPLVAVGLFYQVDEEMKKEKDPERIATILYKQKLTINKNDAVEKTKKAPPKKQRVKNKVAVKKPKQPKKQAKPEKKPEVKKTAKTDPGSKTAPKKQRVKRVKKPAPKKAATTAKSAAASSRRAAPSARSATKSPNKGVVDTYKSADFKSSISSLMAKGGSLRGAKTATSSSSTNIGSANAVGGGVATNLRKADVGTEMGSLTGAATGKIAQSKGAEGLSAKKGIYTAGIPSETVVLGSMDPDVIRRILREHIPQFRYCYQKELDAGRDNVSGTIGLQFTIGASGHVSKAGVSNQTRLPGHVKRCVVNVLRGIQFPSPIGGGTVEVKQPFNFYPKRL